MCTPVKYGSATCDTMFERHAMLTNWKPKHTHCLVFMLHRYAAIAYVVKSDNCALLTVSCVCRSSIESTQHHVQELLHVDSLMTTPC